MPTPNLGLIPIASAQSQKHVTVNEAFARLDAAVQLTVKDRTRTSPPLAPDDGDRYLVASAGGGDWSGHKAEIAAWDASAQGWIFLAPLEGWHVWIIAEQQMLRFDGTAWRIETSSQLGINATPDSVNRLVVASEAVLLTHEGGSTQTKLNKAGDSDTASILFQSNYAGHAEIGLTGSNDLQIKTSPDGGTFTDAMTLDAETGAATLPVPALVNGLSVSPEMALNILPDQGRFGGEEANDGLRASIFVKPGYLKEYNGSAFNGHARFIHNSSTYNGSSGPLDSEIDALLALTRDPLQRRYGSEWWAMKITMGSGRLAGIRVNGTTRYLSLQNNAAPAPRAYSVGFYLRSLSGSAYVNQNLTTRFARWGNDETGNLDAGVIEPEDGWVFIDRQMTHNNFGYNAGVIRVYLENPGDEALIALPRVTVGHMALDPYLPGPMPNAGCFG